MLREKGGGNYSETVKVGGQADAGGGKAWLWMTESSRALTSSTPLPGFSHRRTIQWDHQRRRWIEMGQCVLEPLPLYLRTRLFGCWLFQINLGFSGWCLVFNKFSGHMFRVLSIILCNLMMDLFYYYSPAFKYHIFAFKLTFLVSCLSGSSYHFRQLTCFLASVFELFLFQLFKSVVLSSFAIFEVIH